MTQKENNSVNTDQAWHLLYTRLEKDGLLPDEASQKPSWLLRPSIIKWAAAILVLCISTTTVLFLRDKDSNNDANLLTLHNDKGSFTLVKTLEDGSIVYLGDDTQIQYPEHFSSNKREVKLQGNALFDVAGNKDRPFMIETEDIHIEVIGTSFNVKSGNHVPFELSVARGEVKVTWKRNGESIHVRAGETVTLSSDHLKLGQTEIINKFNQFTERIRFKDEKIGDILQVVNKRSTGIKLEATSSVINRKINVSFENDTPETIAEVLCLAFNLKYEKENDILLISEP